MRFFTITLAAVCFCSAIQNTATGQVLIEPDFIMTGDANNDDFGAGVGISSQAIVVADDGARRAFVYDPETGEQRRVLTADVERPTRADFSFGFDVDVWENLALLGARRSSYPAETGIHPGAAFLFDVNTGEQLHHFLTDACDPCGAIGIFGFFGNSVALNENYAAIGEDRGRAFVYDVESGEEVFRFTPENELGFTDVALAGHLLAVGARDNVFVLDLSTQQQILHIPLEPDVWDTAVEISHDRVFVYTVDEISSYDMEGNLLASGATDSLGVDTRSFAYANGWLAAETQIFDSESLKPMLRYTRELSPSVAIYDNQAVIGVPFQNQDSAYSFTVPEPAISWIWGVAICLCLSRSSRR